ncbi:hypothetical protein DFH11DRAFT_1631329 [Phellopilus nigrolimitatus]|nr:hypothetical protein DFH11DRAFT_1631329 [Phellopilus nigrolimitatus]
MIKRKQDELAEDSTGTKRAKVTQESDVEQALVRRSSRIRSKKVVIEVVGSSMSEQKASTSKPTRSIRRRISNVGRLEKLMNMPLDIFCEVAASLNPHDILNMSRSSRSLRSLLMSKQSKSIWRAARQSLDMPECPSDLSEPEYADLVFGRGCYLCGAPRGHILFYSLRLRLCASCRDDRLCIKLELVYHNENIGQAVLNDIFLMLPSGELGAARYFKDQFYAVSQTYLSLNPSSVEGIAYKQERQSLVDEIMDNAEEMKLWLSLEKERKVAHLTSLSQTRKESIYAKLKTLGYSDIDLDTSFDRHELRMKWSKIVMEPKALTTRIWNNIVPRLCQMINERKEATARRTAYQAQINAALASIHTTGEDPDPDWNPENEVYNEDEDFEDYGSDYDSDYDSDDSDDGVSSRALLLACLLMVDHAMEL